MNALVTMGALKMGLVEEELQPLVDQWRSANPMIVRLWKEVQDAATKAVQDKVVVRVRGLVEYSCQSGMLFAKMPSGKNLAYAKPRVEVDGWKKTLSFEGMNQVTKQWGTNTTWGGRLVENIVQAIARDCLAEAMLRLNNAGYKIVGHVHDEVIVEVPEDIDCLEDICNIMGAPISWAPGLPMRADGYSCEFYMKE
jgi:DNA polymerase